MNYCFMCSSGCHFCETKKDMELKDLEKKYEELGKEIEALKEDDLSVDLSEFEYGKFNDIDGTSLLFEVRNEEEYTGKAFYLDKDWNWQIKDDSMGEKVLIPTKKK